MSRTITVTKTAVIREGSGEKGPWALRSVEALDLSGAPIAEKLKTFADLPLGEVEVDVERQEHEQYGVSFLLKPVGGGGRRGGGGGGGDAEVAQLRSRIERLESEVKRIAAVVDRRDFEPATSEFTGIPDDDIPF